MDDIDRVSEFGWERGSDRISGTVERIVRNTNSSSKRGLTVLLHSIYVPAVKEGEDVDSSEEVAVLTGSELV